MDSDGYGLKFKLVDFLDRYGFKSVQGSYAIRVVCILGEWVLKKMSFESLLYRGEWMRSGVVVVGYEDLVGCEMGKRDVTPDACLCCNLNRSWSVISTQPSAQQTQYHLSKG